MNYETLQVKVDNKNVASVQLNLPEKRNALSAQMIADLTQMSKDIGADPKIRAVVLSGAGKVFCAGGDLDWMKAQIDADRSTRMAEARKLAEMLQALNEMPKPLIGRIHGAAMGGGVGLVSVCDVAFAHSSTKFGFTETRLGLIPATISPYVLARMGEGNARRVFMSARIFSATEAVNLGLVAEASEHLGIAIKREVDAYLGVAPIAVAEAKALCRELGARIDADIIDDTIQRLADTWEGEEASKGIDAFLTKTNPPWGKP